MYTDEELLRCFALFLACRNFKGVLSPDEIADLLFSTTVVSLDLMALEEGEIVVH